MVTKIVRKIADYTYLQDMGYFVQIYLDDHVSLSYLIALVSAHPQLSTIETFAAKTLVPG